MKDLKDKLRKIWILVNASIPTGVTKELTNGIKISIDRNGNFQIDFDKTNSKMLKSYSRYEECMGEEKEFLKVNSDFLIETRSRNPRFMRNKSTVSVFQQNKEHSSSFINEDDENFDIFDLKWKEDFEKAARRYNLFWPLTKRKETFSIIKARSRETVYKYSISFNVLEESFTREEFAEIEKEIKALKSEGDFKDLDLLLTLIK